MSVTAKPRLFGGLVNAQSDGRASAYEMSALNPQQYRGALVNVAAVAQADVTRRGEASGEPLRLTLDANNRLSVTVRTYVPEQVREKTPRREPKRMQAQPRGQ